MVLFGLVAALPLRAQTLAAPPLSAMSPPEGALRIIEQTSTGVVYEFRADWPTPLADAVRRNESLALVAMRAARGEGLASKALALPTTDAPAVEILSADFDEIAYTAPNADDAAARYTGPAAEVVAIGLERRVPTGTFRARVIQYDPERRVLRRHRRLVVAVRYPSARTAAGPARRGGDDNPHLEVGTSVLASGTWFKFPVRTEGIYRIDRAYLQALGLSPDAIDPNSVAVFGNGGTPLPALNSAPRIADLAENASFVVGGGDGSFGDGDAVYFYGAAPNGWRWDQGEADAGRPGWRHFINLFSTDNYYFVRVDAPAAQRVSDPGFAALPGVAVLSQVVGRVFQEEDLPAGMIDRDGGGSGLDWMGREVSASIPSATVLDTLAAGLAGGTVRYRARVATRTGETVTLTLRSGQQEIASTSLRRGSGVFADAKTIYGESTAAANDRLLVTLGLSGSAVSRQGWIDYVEAFYPQTLRAEGDYLRFHTPGGATGAFEFVLSGFTSMPQVWDVTEPNAIRRLGVTPGDGTHRVQIEVSDAERPRELVAFTPSSAAVRTPAVGVAVPNQNLHSVNGFPDYVIVVPAGFRAAADELAEHRATDGLRPLVVDVEQIYNEFAGGLADMRAVRDYLRFLYDRSPAGDPALRYALFFGDGHFDFRGIREGAAGTNFVPTYQTENSLDGDRSYTSDDYFALLDPDEGDAWDISYGDQSERVDIGIGRFTVQTAAGAAAAVAKVKRYENPATQGDWRTRVTFVADDQYPNITWDTDAHVLHAEVVSDTLRVVWPEANIQKIYAGSYQRVQTALGARYPEAQEDIMRSIEEGTLVWNYSGHGGSGGLADERLLVKEDIERLDNADRLPVFITATCTFGRFDLIEEQSGAELLMLNTGGGAAAVFTTTRIVYAGFTPTSFNLGLNRVLAEYLFSRDETGRPRRLGDAQRLTKADNVGAQPNNRKFVLLGDPAMRIQLPERPVAITAVNGTPVGGREEGWNGVALDPAGKLALDSAAPALGRGEASAAADSKSEARRSGLPQIRALERAEIQGEVRTLDGAFDPSYNGEVDVTVYDAIRTTRLPEEAINYTDGEFEERSDLIFRGRATVRDGVFTTRFIVPRDISYADEPGRISAYASNAVGNDGSGYTEQFLVGSTSDNPIQDSEGPRIGLFMNDTTFVSGGLVGTTPVLIAKLFDQNGINTVGTGVGHELLLTIDGAEQDAIALSRFYRGDLDSYQSGQVVFEMPEQAPGPHTLTLRAWDVANNATTATLDYYVEPDGELALRNVYNYPNPTNGPTRFVFEHNQAPGTVANVQVRIYTLSGRPVRTLDATEALPEGILTGSLVQIPWDGRDEDFDTLATGIYLYKVRVEVEREGGDRQVSERIERLAVIR